MLLLTPFLRYLKIIEKKTEENPNTWKYFGETITNGVTIEQKDKRTSITLKNIVLENLLKR